LYLDIPIADRVLRVKLHGEHSRRLPKSKIGNQKSQICERTDSSIGRASDS
jgi:hypothetical protein